MKKIHFASSFVIAISIIGCSTAVTQKVAFSTTPDKAYECAMGAARDIGFQIESSDQKSGIFSAVKAGTSSLNPIEMANYQAYFAVDKQLKSVQANFQGFGQIIPDQGAVNKLNSSFQAAFIKRCS